MLKEVIVVEGKSDVAAIGRAVEADCLITGGFGLSRRALDDIKAAYKKRGIIIMTDPDPAGERIRRYLEQRFPRAKHAYIPKEDATDPTDGDVGIEDASPEAIRRALATVRTPDFTPTATFSGADLIAARLNGCAAAAARRARMGALLGVGFANAKTFLTRLNHYGVTRDEFAAALRQLAAQEETDGN